MRKLLLTGFLLFEISVFAQTQRGLYNLNVFPELENASYNNNKSAGNLTLFGNIPNNEFRSDFYSFGANAILYKKKSVTLAANYNFTGENLMLFNNIKGSYIYRLNIKNGLTADFGVTLGALNPSINMEKVVAVDEFDPALVLLSERNLWYLDANASAVFTIKEKLKLGVSFNRFPTQSIEVENSAYLTLPRKLHANVLYDFGESSSNITQGMKLGVWYSRFDTISRMNISVSKQLNDQIGLNIGYITNPKIIHLGVHITIGQNKICYSTGLNQQSSIFGNGTEVVLEANLGKSKPVTTNDQNESGEEGIAIDTVDSEFLDRTEFVFLSDTTESEKVSVYNPLPTDFIVEIERWDDLKKIRMGHDTAKIILKSVKNTPFKPGYYLMVKMSPSEKTIDDEIKRLFTLGTVSYKLHDPKMNVYYQFVDWTLEEVESSKQLQYFDKEFKYLWIKSFK